MQLRARGLLVSLEAMAEGEAMENLSQRYLKFNVCSFQFNKE